MLAILGKILGSGDVVLKGMELIDSLHTSTEEELQAKAKAKTDLLTAYQPYKLAQRYLALMFASTFLFSFFLVLTLTLAGVGKNCGDQGNTLRVLYRRIMLTIVVFYFGRGLCRRCDECQKKQGRVKIALYDLRLMS